jgi:ParB family chromosome partitioning protein
MRRPRYPLESLAAHRARKVEGAVQGLAKAVAEREQAGQARLAREQARAAQEATAASIARAERDSLERGELQAADLARAHAWQLRSEAEHAALTSAVDQARAAEAGAVKGEGQARVQVAERRADADVVDRDRARWTAVERKRADAKEEEAMAEAFRPRR